MTRTWRGVAALVLVATALAGCTSGTSGQVRPTLATSSTPTTSDPSQAPKVDHPLDASKMVASPCSALTPTQLAALRITNPINSPRSDAYGTDCGWQSDDGANVGIGWLTVNTGGLSDLYVKSRTIAYWQPTTVDGYPAAFGDPLTDGRAQGDCVLHVAVSDHLYFDSSYNYTADPGPSCDLARQAAVDVLRNLGAS